MTWKEANAMELRRQFIRDWKNGKRTVMELCAMYSISRKTAYKWIERYEKEGLADPMSGQWAADRSHAAHVVHNRTPELIEDALLAWRLRHPSWGARKLLNEVGLEHPGWTLPHWLTTITLSGRRQLSWPVETDAGRAREAGLP